MALMSRSRLGSLFVRLVWVALVGAPIATAAWANPAITPTTVLLVKACTGVDWDEPCTWTGGPGGEIQGEITIDDALGIDITKIETRSLGAVAWTDVTANFAADPLNGIRAERTGDIAWDDPFGVNVVDVPCGFFDERIVDLRITTEYTDPFGETITVAWVVQVIFKMVCEECNTGALEADSSGDQHQPTRPHDQPLRISFSVINGTPIPRTLSIDVSSEQPWAIDPPFPLLVQRDPGVAAFPDITITLTVPAGTLDGTSSVVTFTAVDVDDPSVSVADQVTVFVDDSAAALELVPLSPVVSMLVLGGLLSGSGAAAAVRVSHRRY